MYLGIRMMFAGFVMLGIAMFFVMNTFVAEIRPSVREVTEEVMVDAAHLLAEVASDDLASGAIASGRFANHVRAYRQRAVNVAIWGIAKETLDFQVYVTDARGIVQFDSEDKAVGEDFSRWRDVALTLRGEYGARATREKSSDYGPTIYYVAAPVKSAGRLIGVLTVAKPMDTIEPFIDRAEWRVIKSAAWLLLWSLLIGAGITIWTVYEVRRLARYAEDVDAGKRVPVPEVRGELGKLARAMASMRTRLEGQQYVERYVTALTHELKSPLAAIRASGELLTEPMNDADRARFAGHVVDQSARMQRSVDRLLELTRLEQTQRLDDAKNHDVGSLMSEVVDSLKPRADGAQVHIELSLPSRPVGAVMERELMKLALSNVLENAIAFSNVGGRVLVNVESNASYVDLVVSDSGPGVDPMLLPRIGERFVSTPRPSGAPKSSGLGLAIVKQVMALHQGEFSIVNAALGARAVLRLRIA
ncbi:MAG: two-component system sensor histidine kinase CreC [Betaproteobacteria bacterium]|nr:MAG: two-component system sensor histidine kinase CreC [Betaproteobacteria bacterium]